MFVQLTKISNARSSILRSFVDSCAGDRVTLTDTDIVVKEGGNMREITDNMLSIGAKCKMRSNENV